MEGLEGVAQVVENSGGWFELIAGTVLTAITGAVGWLITTVLGTKSLAEATAARVDDVEEDLKAYRDIPAQIAGLKAQQEANFNEVLRSLNRLEAHTLRQQGKDS